MIQGLAYPAFDDVSGDIASVVGPCSSSTGALTEEAPHVRQGPAQTAIDDVSGDIASVADDVVLVQDKEKKEFMDVPKLREPWTDGFWTDSSEDHGDAHLTKHDGLCVMKCKMEVVEKGEKEAAAKCERVAFEMCAKEAAAKHEMEKNCAGSCWEPLPLLSLLDSFALRAVSTSHLRWAVMLDDEVGMKADFDSEDEEEELWRSCDG